MTKISGLASLAVIRPDDLVPVVDIHDGSMAATGTTKKITAGSLVGLAPSGDTSGVTDPANVQGLITLGITRIQLQPGKFYGNAPVVAQVNGVQIRGSGGATASGNDASLDLGTTWVIVAGFSNPNSWSALVTAAFVSIQTSPGTGAGGSDTANAINGHRYSDFWIDGSASPAAVDGIAQFGNVGATQIERVGCYKVTGRAFPAYIDSSYGSANNPDGQHYYSCVAQSGGGSGFYGAMVDSVLIDCHAQGNGNDGFVFNNGANNRLIGCRSDLNTGHGYTLDCATTIGTQTFNDCNTLVGCGTQGNTKNGLNVTNSSANGLSTRAAVVATGCTFDGDGTNGGIGGGGFAGIAVAGRNMVSVTGCNVMVATQWVPTTGSPQYGVAAAVAGSSNAPPLLLNVSGGLISGVTASVNDALNVIRLDNGVATFVGGEPGNAVTTSYPPVPADPADNTLFAWAFDPVICNASPTMVSQTFYMTGIYVRQPITVTKIFISVHAAASGNTSGGACIINSAGTVVASSASMTPFQTVGVQNWTVTSTTLPPGQYWVGMFINAGTIGSLVAANNVGTGFAVVDVNQAAANFRFAVNGTTVTAIPGSVTLASNTTTGALLFWAGLG